MLIAIDPLLNMDRATSRSSYVMHCILPPVAVLSSNDQRVNRKQVRTKDINRGIIFHPFIKCTNLLACPALRLEGNNPGIQASRVVLGATGMSY